MTIGIGAYGPNAGLAVFEALSAAEAVGRGAIGGFASYAAVDEDGRIFRHQTQRGGSRTLFVEGDAVGVAPPAHVARAVAAAVISSGPDRFEPLSQYLAADPQVGLVTGHRLPNGLSLDGTPLNGETLDHLAAGKSAREAVRAVIDRNAEADVGLIAVDLKGGVYRQNSVRVSRRPDLGGARMEDAAVEASVEVLHNGIRPFPILASLSATVAIEVMQGEQHPIGWITVPAGLPLVLAKENAVHCDRGLVATKVTTTDPLLVRGRQIGVAIYVHSRVYRDDELLGLTLLEPIVTVEDGIVVDMNGQNSFTMGYHAARARPISTADRSARISSRHRANDRVKAHRRLP